MSNETIYIVLKETGLANLLAVQVLGIGLEQLVVEEEIFTFDVDSFSS